MNRFKDSRLPKQILYSQFREGSCKTGRPKLRYKGIIKRNLGLINISSHNWQYLSKNKNKSEGRISRLSLSNIMDNVDSWKFSMLLLYILWDGWPIFMISGSNKQLQQELEYTRLKPDCHSWWISKIQSGREEERYAIKFYFKLGKMPQKRIECFRLLFDHLAWSEHQFLSGIRDSRKAGSLWEMMRGVGGVRKSIHQSWLAKGLGLGLLCWGFKGVPEEISSEEASTLQIGSAAFPPGQYTSP